MTQPPWGEEFSADFERRATELREHLEQIAPSLRGLPFDVAEQRLRDELRARGLDANETMVGSVARMAADPSWPMRHPLQFRRYMKEQDERIQKHNAAIEAQERENLVALWGDAKADAFLATDPVTQAVEAVMDDLDVACSFSVVPPEAHDGRRYLVQVRPYSERLAKRIERAIATVGAGAEVRELTAHDRPPWEF